MEGYVNLPKTKDRIIIETLDEYEEKLENIDVNIAAFEAAGERLKGQLCVYGVYGQEHLDVGKVYSHKAKQSLLRSAWLRIYTAYNLEKLLSPNEKKKFDQGLNDLPPFTYENVLATFGGYIENPKEAILQSLAEVFSGLDQSYKSHEKVRVGVKGLPKRVIISSINNYCYGWGHDKIVAILNALAAYQRKPLVSHAEMSTLLKGGELLENKFDDDKQTHWNRGVWLKRFKNGNGHLFFDELTLVDINKALSEYYGDVLPDVQTRESNSRNTNLSKDLQYYPTPSVVVDCMLDDIYFRPTDKVLEPSCGCGRIMDKVREKGADVYGIEVDYNRATEARIKGHKVQVANFLETVPEAKYDYVIMNPPFYGKHYALHVEHALKFLKEGGKLKAVLPATARYDHGLLNGWWTDLPVGSFKKSGTNINTTILTIRN
jgi:2-polyprenyl-3-methyl-5-hydroxy-6-metoxy-1,4-benzoquinol methylase